MQLGITIDLSGAQPRLDMDRVLEAERLGFAQVWTGEAYGTDAVTPVAWILARTTRIKAGTGIMQMHARTPAMAAMTAITLQHLSGNRFLCGVGVSGPQVVEGWHGVPYGKPMLRTKEYIAIIRQVLERKEGGGHLLPGNDLLPEHEGMVITRGLREWACLLPLDAGFETVKRLLGWITREESVLSEAGLIIPDEQENEVEKFREFLDSVSPEDFRGADT